MKPPRISIVMPFLNGDLYIREAVASVRAQTLGPELDAWELVLVDDGSTDSSAGWARGEAATDPRLRVLAHPEVAGLGVNRGADASRVLGADAARGQYLMFLDHDDVLRPFALERMAAVLDGEPDVAAVFAATLFWAFDPTLGSEDWAQDFAPLSPGRIDRTAMLRELIRTDQRHPAPCSVLFRRAELLSARDAAPPFPGMYDDTAVLMKLLCFHDVWLMPEVVSSYRMHAASMCHQAEAAGSWTGHGYSPDRARYLRWAVRHLPMDWKSRALAVKVLAKYALGRLRTINSPRADKGVGSAQKSS